MLTLYKTALTKFKSLYVTLVGMTIMSINLKFSTETHNNDLQNILNYQLYKVYNLDFIILMTSHENDLLNVFELWFVMLDTLCWIL